eukprot:jgi/Ulvmu1/6624/UM003_0262.1
MGENVGTRKQLSPWVRDYACGCIAGAVNVFVGYPFDTVKVTLQNSSPGRFTGPIQCCSHIVGSRGVSGLFAGVTSPIVGGAIETGVNYLVYSSVLQQLHSSCTGPTPDGNATEHSHVHNTTQSSALLAASSDSDDAPAVQPNNEAPSNHATDTAATADPQPSLAHVAAAAAVAGVALSFVLSPTELVKCRMQVHPAYYQTPLRCLRLTLRSEGPRGLLRGLPATLAREVPGNALFFTTYEACKRVLVPVRPAAVSTSDPTSAQRSTPSTPSTTAAQLSDFLGTVISGGIAGCVMWGTVLPIDAAKTRIQAEFRGGRHDAGLGVVMRAMWREGGLRCWWGGLAPTLLRAFPANAAQWMAWEAAQHMLR